MLLQVFAALILFYMCKRHYSCSGAAAACCHVACVVACYEGHVQLTVVCCISVAVCSQYCFLCS